MDTERQRRAPLFEAVVNYAHKGKLSFHTPGHKHGKGIEERFKRYVGSNIFRMDLTLLEEVDSLHDPIGVIKEAQELAAEAYGADYSFFLVNGTSGGNHAMILATCDPGEKIIIPRNAHKSVLAGVILSGAYPIYVRPEVDRELNVICNVTPELIAKAIESHPDAKAVLITNPTYNGIATDLEEIVKVAHRFKKIVLVDEAHGPHLKFSNELPISAMEAGADMCVQSSHKIISALTQSSLLQAKKGRIDITRLRKVLQMLQTTSPSYILMSSLDLARMQMAVYGKELLKRTIALAEETRRRINQIKGFSCFGREVVGRPGIYDLDVTKLTITAKDLGLTGYEVAKILNHKYDIQVEYADLYNFLLIISIGNDAEDGDRLVNALEEIAKVKGRAKGKILPFRRLEFPNLSTETVLNPREAISSLTKTVPFKEAIGQISSETISPYPPGIPVLVPGERITAEIYEYLVGLNSLGARIDGQDDLDLKTIKVIRERGGNLAS